MRVSKKDIELIHDFAEQAWALSEDEIKNLEPGNIEKALDLIRDNNNTLTNHCFSKRSSFEIEHPDLHLLKMMRNPDFFPFTCRVLFNLEGDNPLKIMPFQNICLKELWIRQFPMLIATRGGSKSFMLALYIMLRLLFCQGSKIVVVGSSFRQAKLIFEYMERFWYNSSIYRDLVIGNKGSRGRDNGPRRDIDRCEMVIGDSVCICLPQGDGEKIRGIRSNYTICDEFSSINITVFEKVIQAYGSVSSDPVRNYESQSKKNFLEKVGFWSEEADKIEKSKKRGNQNVLAGTPDYYFGHFYKYWKEYKSIIETRNDIKLVKELFHGDLPESFDANDFCIIRLPYDLVPKGYMDEKTVVRAQQLSDSAQFACEYGACFLSDSDGFFKRSLIHKCEVRESNQTIPSFESCGWKRPDFIASIFGRHDKKYYFGIDPASENDNFAITIIEDWCDHRRVVYCWTIDKERHREKLKRKVVEQHDFFKYCNRKIRDLMKVFPPARILVDSGGGGTTMREAFRDTTSLLEDEEPIYEVIDYNKPKDTDDLSGHHILEMVHFQSSDWVRDANYGLKKDMESQIILFPANEGLDVGLAMEDDINSGRVKMNSDEVEQIYDSLEDCILEIEEMKNELTTIVVTKSENGREKWSTPAHKVVGQKKGRLKKDRYSALLIANMGARQNLNNENMRYVLEKNSGYQSDGGFAQNIISKGNTKGQAYFAPPWFKPHW